MFALHIPCITFLGYITIFLKPTPEILEKVRGKGQPPSSVVDEDIPVSPFLFFYITFLSILT